MPVPARPVTLCMIVRDESPRIRRCLTSVLPFIDFWVVADTGSRDDTSEVVLDALKTIPGELIHVPWQDFSTSRNAVLEVACSRQGYGMVIDADEVIEVQDKYVFSNLDLDSYLVKTRLNNIDYWRRQIFNFRKPWRYEGAVHERLQCAQTHSEGYLSGVINRPFQDSPRNQNPNKYQLDLVILQKMIRENPLDARNALLLARGYLETGARESAYEAFQEVLPLCDEHNHEQKDYLWFSHYYLGLIAEELGMRVTTILDHYQSAFDVDTSRAEPVTRMVRYFLSQGDEQTARALFALIDQAELPDRGFMVFRSVYESEIPALRQILTP